MAMSTSAVLLRWRRERERRFSEWVRSRRPRWRRGRAALWPAAAGAAVSDGAGAGGAVLAAELTDCSGSDMTPTW